MNDHMYSVLTRPLSSSTMSELVIVREQPPVYQEDNVITRPELMAQAIYDIAQYWDDVEHMLSIPLNQANHPLGIHIVNKGTVNAVSVEPRDIFRMAIMLNATSIIMAHTHPSGNPYPSEADRVLTNRMKDLGKTLGIHILDHIVVGLGKEMSYYSIETFSNNHR